jgi:hypothetical protein
LKFQTLAKLLASIRQPQDITPDLLEGLNIHLTPDIGFIDLLPDKVPFDTSKPFIPNDRNSTAERMSQMILELGYDNDRALKALFRSGKADDSEKVKLLYARRFWIGLEQMSQYWDTSLDDYYEVPERPSGTIPRTDPRLASMTDECVEGDNLMLTANNRDSDFSKVDEKTEDLPPLKRVYKGRRTGTGREMPEDFRDEMLKGFVEPAAWAYGCQVVKPLMQPRLAIGTMLVPVKHNLVVGRSPKERAAARRGLLEGPVLAILGRNTLGYWIDAPWPELEGSKAEVYDLLREVGAMLRLAQERAREGKKEVRPGAGKWWTTKPRWGGGSGGPIGWEDELQKEYYLEGGRVKCEKARKRPLTETEVDKILAEPMEDGLQGEKAPIPMDIKKKSGREARKGAAAKPGGNLKRWNMMADRWKLIQTGLSLWDDQRIYMRIGKEQLRAGVSPTEAFDNIFLVSSMNHHISILRMRVSDRYLAWLQGASGEEKQALSKESLQPQEKSGRLQLWRTRWYDMFNPEERLEAQRGLWQVMGWLTKQEEK